jgi:hypothetical protein
MSSSERDEAYESQSQQSQPFSFSRSQSQSQQRNLQFPPLSSSHSFSQKNSPDVWSKSRNSDVLAKIEQELIAFSACVGELKDKISDQVTLAVKNGLEREDRVKLEEYERQIDELKIQNGRLSGIIDEMKSEVKEKNVLQNQLLNMKVKNVRE